MPECKILGDENMRVLYTTNIPVPYKIHFFNLLAQTIELTVAFERSSANDRNKEWLSSVDFQFDSIFLNGIKVGSDSSLSKQIIDVINNGHFDKIIVGVYHTPTAMLMIHYLKKHKIPYMISSDGGFINYNDSVIKKAIKRYFMSGAEHYFSPGKETNKYLEWYGAQKNQISLYPFTSILKKDVCADIISIERKTEIKRANRLPQKKIVLSVGQFIPRKGMDILIRACGRIQEDICLCIVGGEAPDEYVALAQEFNNLEVMFVPFVGKKDLEIYYSVADVFVLATREDIWGLVVNEAMAYGLPVVTTTSCMAGIELIQNGKNGYLVSSENVEELALKIQSILNSDCYIKMQHECIEIAQIYTIENMADSYLEIFCEDNARNKEIL